VAVGTKKSKTRDRRRKTKPNIWVARLRGAVRIAARGFLIAIGVQALVIFLFAYLNPPTNYYMLSEHFRLGAVTQDWVRLADVPADVPRAFVAAEDANFCEHWGFDLAAIRAVVESSNRRLRGASTISQQVAKNVFLWPQRSWLRKAFEAETTLLIELLWPKRRIIEVYFNVAELDKGVFGVGAAAAHYFGVKASQLTLLQSARLAAILPNPKHRSASKPGPKTRARAKAIMDGARTIAADGRDACFQVLK